jgi:chromosome segregation ATPase
MTDELNQQQPVSAAVESPVAATAEVSAQATAPVTTPEQVAPPQAENQPKRRDAEARINQLTAKYKLTNDELEQARTEINRLESATNAGGSDGAAPVAQPDNPYAPIGTGSNGEVAQDDLEGLPPVMRQMYDRVQEMTKERENAKTTTALEQSIATNFEAYPEIAGVVDDAEIALELSKRRIPLHNADLVFAGRALGVARAQIKSLETEIASLKGDLHKDTVASPVTGSTKPAPSDKIEPDYKPGEAMAAARRKAMAKG